MNIDNLIIESDLEYINSIDFIDWEKLKKKTFFITGATGLIGFNIINSLLYVDSKRELGLKIIALVRNKDKALMRFANCLDNNSLIFIEGDIRNFSYPTNSIDYIIHGASITASKEFVDNPNEVKDIANKGTINVLKLAKIKNVKSFVYLSSMEVYGIQKKGHVCKEEDNYIFDKNEPRNSYPISKQECEQLCIKKYKDEDISVKIARLSQVFGPGMNMKDKRIMVEFAKCAIEKKDIVLHTTGESERCYTYTADVVTAILSILLNGENGNIYNVANPSTYCSIKGLAEYIARTIANDDIKVVFDNNYNGKGYMDTSYYLLDTSKLESIGWKYNFGLDSFKYIYKK